jgi:hypothetical protein
MARIEGEIVIGRPVDVVFDYVADQSNEPHYNPQMVRAEKITAGAVGKGTRFRSAVASRGRTVGFRSRVHVWSEALCPHRGIADLVTCSAYRRPWAVLRVSISWPQ